MGRPSISAVDGGLLVAFPIAWSCGADVNKSNCACFKLVEVDKLRPPNQGFPARDRRSS